MARSALASNARKWNEAVPAYEKAGAIFIGDRRGNAMIIPGRAFSSDLERDECLSAIERWQQAQLER